MPNYHKLSAKEFDFKKVKTLSNNQLSQHYQLYKGYINKTNELWSQLENVNLENTNTAFSPYRCIKIGESFALNGVKLHELYFSNLGGQGGKASGSILKMLEDDFGSFDNWLAYFKAAGLSARGWAVLALDSIDGKLHNYIQDAHDIGVITLSYPLLVLDVYEHAYMIDFGVDRKSYLEAYFKTIDWDVVNQRLEFLLGAKK